ncbi:MAG TPA: hypothetical protein PK528_11580 [Syntrophorhabdus sp.]|jgi:metal-responsive CopG/Arc/MetJ family transcriptional regulator|nr:hypothetical protein [Syntrophorhabdus sp.]
MVKKLTISIPDNLHKKLEQYRDRIPISSVCASAIRDAISEIEDCVREARKRFYLLSIDEACELAYEKGIHWAGYEAEPEELAYVAEWANDIRGSLFEKLVDSNKRLENLALDGNNLVIDLYSFVFNEGYLNDILPPFMNENNDDIPIIMEFSRGAKVVWDEVKEDLLPKLLNSNDDL